MTDNLTKKQRSLNMSKIRSKWTLQEKKVHNYLKGNKIKHKMHPKIYGNPDILLKESNTLIFLDGCFWHKCPKCFKMPKSNKKYWRSKIEKNMKRDRLNRSKLRKLGFDIKRIREHEIRNDFEKSLMKLVN